MDPKIKEIYDSILEGQQNETVSGVQAAIDAGSGPR